MYFREMQESPQGLLVEPQCLQQATWIAVGRGADTGAFVFVGRDVGIDIGVIVALGGRVVAVYIGI